MNKNFIVLGIPRLETLDHKDLDLVIQDIDFASHFKSLTIQEFLDKNLQDPKGQTHHTILLNCHERSLLPTNVGSGILSLNFASLDRNYGGSSSEGTLPHEFCQQIRSFTPRTRYYTFELFGLFKSVYFHTPHPLAPSRESYAAPTPTNINAVSAPTLV